MHRNFFRNVARERIPHIPSLELDLRGPTFRSSILGANVLTGTAAATTCPRHLRKVALESIPRAYATNHMLTNLGRQNRVLDTCRSPWCIAGFAIASELRNDSARPLPDDTTPPRSCICCSSFGSQAANAEQEGRCKDGSAPSGLLEMTPEGEERSSVLKRFRLGRYSPPFCDRSGVWQKG
eukprot:5336100-Amphidinium_carterae.1